MGNYSVLKSKFVILLALFSAIVVLQLLDRNKTTIPSQKTVAEKAALLKKTIRAAKGRPPRVVESSVSETNSIEEKPERQLTNEEVEAYLTKTKRCAECLLNAFNATGDHSYFKEALEKFPDNPLMQLTLLTDGRLQDELSPKDRKLWQERFKATLPNNAFPNYLVAIDAFKDGQTDLGLSELTSALQKGTIDLLYRDRMRSSQEMYLLSGFAPEEAARRATEELMIPSESEMKGLSTRLADLRGKYIDAGDNASAQQITMMGIEMARRWGNDESNPVLISQLVGMGMERTLLRELNPDTVNDFLGITPAQRIEELRNQRQEMRELAQSTGQIFPQLSNSEKLVYWNRRQAQGELNAMKWVNQNYGTKP